MRARRLRRLREAFPDIHNGPSGLARGGALFEVHCLACHGREGRGSPQFGVVLQDFLADANPGDIVDLVLHAGSDASSAMPAFDGTLSKDQDSDIVSCLTNARAH